MILFPHLQPSQNFYITIMEIAKMLGISPRIIVRMERWKYIIFIHRRDRGGQFLSYRKLYKWQCAVASKIQKCADKEKLKQLWWAIEADCEKFSKQYQVDAYLTFLREVWTRQWNRLVLA